MRPGPVIVARHDHYLSQPNGALRAYRREVAEAIRKARTLDDETRDVVWALCLAGDSWDNVPAWVRLLLDQ